MPELPEVATVVNLLRSDLVGATILRVEILHAKTWQSADVREIGQKIQAVLRYGKYIILQLETGYIVIHLRMTGQLFLSRSEHDLKHTHLRLKLQLSSDRTLIFLDQRKFGRALFCLSLEWLLAKFGPNALDPNFNEIKLYQALHGSRQKIKAFLLDQTKLAGLGNIYVDELLWAVKIHPMCCANIITRAETEQLYRTMQEILKMAIKFNGTTFQSYSFAGNQMGLFLNYLQVFGRHGQPCPRCQTVIVKLRVAQRGTYICPSCQKL